MFERMTEGLDFHASALRLRAMRQQLLSSNIANASTPGYQARDFSFARELAEQVGQPANDGFAQRGEGGAAALALAQPGASARAARPGGLGMSASSAGHLGGGADAADLAGQVRPGWRVPIQPTADGNTVDMDTERAQFAQNTVGYQATLRFINSRMSTMMSAIRGE